MTITDLLPAITIEEPILVDWASDQIQNDNSSDQAERKLIEDHVFNDAAVRYMLESYDNHLLNRAFLYVSASRFKGALDKLVDLWRDPGFMYRRTLFPIIHELDRQKALELVIQS